MRFDRFTILVAAILTMFSQSARSAVVFSDPFTPVSATYKFTSGQIGATPWNVSISGGDFGARIHDNVLTLTSNRSSTADSDGWVIAHASTASFSAPYQTTLKNNTSQVIWQFNLQQSHSNPAALTANANGMAFILAGSKPNPLGNESTNGNGYAILLGNSTNASSSTDPIRLVRYTNGLQSPVANLITAGAPLADIATEYLSLRVTYDPSNDQWSMFGRNDGTGFADPASGELTSLGASVVNNTHVNAALGYMVACVQSTGTAVTAQFDNISVALAPEPASLSLLGLCAGLLRRRVRRLSRLVD